MDLSIKGSFTIQCKTHTTGQQIYARTVSQNGNAQHYIITFITHISTTTSPYIKIKSSIESQVFVAYYGTCNE